MGKPLSPAMMWTQYLAARVAAMALTMFDAEANLRSAAAMGRAVYRLDKRHRRRAIAHLTACFPELSPRQIERLAVHSFEHFVQLVVEVMHTPRMIHIDRWPYRVRLGNLGPAIELLNAQKPVVMLTGHVGNWEVLGYLLTVLGYDIDAIARPFPNTLVYDWLLGIRQKRGMRIITKFNATDRMLEVLGRGGALGFIADQNAGDKGLFVPFFGRLASTYKSIGLLALSQDVPIICGYAHRLPGGYHYELGTTDIIHPHEWKTQDDPLFYVTARYMHAIENMVRKAPEQYLWMHRRWKTRPRHERQNKPMPASMRRALEKLPWMDQQTMDRLLHPLPANPTVA